MNSSINNNVNLGGFQEIQQLKTFLNGAVFGPNTTYGGQQRIISSNNDYGVITRADESNFYFLLTDKNDAAGSWNNLRPFSIDMSTGDVNAQIAKFSKAQNGYFRFNNGLKVQWGYTTGTTVTFPTAFASAKSFGLSLTAVRTSAGSSWYGQVNSVTATNFKYLQDSSTSPAFWVAIGY